ncbi:unnamed protein product [Closterium sp. NIES-64]|nr:unnamed protein product [Closterium sp. NIES-64]
MARTIFFYAIGGYVATDLHDLELMRERLSKLLLGDDPSGGAKGCGPALAMANAITSVSASVFGDSLRLRPLREEDKNKWRREMGIMVSVCRHIVELAPGWQTRPDGTRFEVMKRRVREDLRINLPALNKLDHLLQINLPALNKLDHLLQVRGAGVCGVWAGRAFGEYVSFGTFLSYSYKDKVVGGRKKVNLSNSFPSSPVSLPFPPPSPLTPGHAREEHFQLIFLLGDEGWERKEQSTSNEYYYEDEVVGGQEPREEDEEEEEEEEEEEREEEEDDVDVDDDDMDGDIVDRDFDLNADVTGGSEGGVGSERGGIGSEERGVGSEKGSAAGGGGSEVTKGGSIKEAFSGREGGRSSRGDCGASGGSGLSGLRGGSPSSNSGEDQEQQEERQQQEEPERHELDEQALEQQFRRSISAPTERRESGDFAEVDKEYAARLRCREDVSAVGMVTSITATSGNNNNSSTSGNATGSGAGSGGDGGGVKELARRRTTGRIGSRSYDLGAFVRGRSKEAAGKADGDCICSSSSGGGGGGGGGSSGGDGGGSEASGAVAGAGAGAAGGGAGVGAGGGGGVPWRWKVKPRMRVGLSEDLRRWLEQQSEKTSQIMKACMFINQQILQEMDVPDAFLQRLPKSLKTILGDRVYSVLLSTPYNEDKVLSAVDLSNQRAALKLACKMEAAQQIWIRQLQTAREPYLTHTLGGSYLSTSSREIMRLEENLERVAACLAAIRRMWPDLPQTTLDLAKIAFNRHLRQPTFPSTSALSLPPFSLVISPLLSLPPPPCHQDIGKAVLESYSRVLEGAASNIRARLRDVLHADHLFNNPQLFPLQDAPSDPRPQHLRHPTFSLLMPDTVFDAVSVSGGSESSASIRSFESSRSGSSGKGGRHFRGGSMVSDSGSLPAHEPKQQQPYLRRTGSFQPTSQSRVGVMRTVRRSQSGGLEEEVMRLKLEAGEAGGDSPVLTKTPGFVLVSASQSGGGGGNSGGSSSRPPHPPNRSASGDWT